MLKKIMTFFIISGFTIVFIAHADSDIGSRSQNGAHGAASLAENISNWQPADSAITDDRPKQDDSYNPTDPEFDIVEYDNFEDKRKEAMRMNDKILKGDDDYDDDAEDDIGDEDGDDDADGDDHKGKGSERRVGGDDHQGKHKGWANNKHQNRNINGESAQIGVDDTDSSQQQSSQQSQSNADLLDQIDNHMSNGAYYDNVGADPMQW